LLADNGNLINQANIKFENGDLVLEAICQNTVSRSEVGSELSNADIKKYLKSLRAKLLNEKTEDKIVSAIISEAIHAAISSSGIVLRFLVHLLLQSTVPGSTSIDPPTGFTNV